MIKSACGHYNVYILIKNPLILYLKIWARAAIFAKYEEGYGP